MAWLPLSRMIHATIETERRGPFTSRPESCILSRGAIRHGRKSPSVSWRMRID